MTNISSNFSYIQESGAWVVKKVAESIKTDRIFYLFPVALSAIASYQSLNHYRMAFFGTDSWSHRKKLFSDGYWEDEYSLKTRLSLIFRSIFGSIELKDRSHEFLYGSAYLGVSLGMLYALHASIVENSQKLGKFDSHFDESTKELFPENHQKYIHDKALDYLAETRTSPEGQSFEIIDHFEKILLNPEVPKFSKNAEMVVHLSDQALLPTPTPFEEHCLRPFKSLIYVLTSGKYGEPSETYSTEHLSTEKLFEVYQKTRQLIIEKEPINWQAHFKNTSKALCNWTWGFSPTVQENDCTNFASLLDENVSKSNEKRLEILDRLYKALMQRAILQGRGNCSTPLGAEDICKEYYTKHVSSVFSKVKSYFTFIQERGSDYVNQLELAKIFPVSSSEQDIKKLDSFATILDNMGADSEKNVSILRSAASHFFGLAENFSKHDFQKAYRTFSIQHHPDKLGTELGNTLFKISGCFNGIFGKKAHEALYQSDLDSTGSALAFPSPWKVIQDLSTWTFDWFKQNPPPLQF